MKLVEDLKAHAAGLDVAAEICVDRPALQARLLICAKLMRDAAKHLNAPDEGQHIPWFIKKQES